MSIKEFLKKVVPDKELRHSLSRFFTKNISDEVMIPLLYWITVGEKLNLKDPKTFNEKLQWYKLYYRDELVTLCSDKFLVRDYVNDQGLSHILTPLYGVYNDANEINFDEIPNECFLKCTHNSNGNILWNKDKAMDIKKIKRNLNKMLSNNAYYSSREWSYKNIKPRIICEELLKANSHHGLVDFNFFCFNGKPRLVMYNTGLSNEKGEHAIGKRAVFDEDFNPLDISTSMEPLPPESISKPKNFDEMLKYATILSKPFPFVRVDFFYMDGEIRFGELTFYSGGGYGKYEPKEWQYILGDYMVLPEKTNRV